jgi:hypothetical protein
MVVPLFNSDSIFIVIFNNSQSLFTIDSPKPVPLISGWFRLSDLKKELKILSLSSSEIPIPSSVILHFIILFSLKNITKNY